MELKQIGKKAALVLLLLVFSSSFVGAGEIELTKVAGYSAGEFNVDGGVMEIISYSQKTGYAYAVNGQSGVLAVIDLSKINENEVLEGIDIDIKGIVEKEDPAFIYGDMTSVSVSSSGDKLALALQDERYDANGRVAIFDCREDGSVVYLFMVEAGVQPDMVLFVGDDLVLSADEGEPRAGFGEGIMDPAGSVTIVDVAGRKSNIVGFSSFDDDASLKALDKSGVLVMNGKLPSVDFEPEYIAYSDGKAYVTLQEANAIAVLDVETGSFDGVYPLGFEDYGKYPVDIDKKDDAYSPISYPGLYGIRMADGISAFTSNGSTYLVTANEGDAREWGDEEEGTFYISEDERDFSDGDTSPLSIVSKVNGNLNGKVVFFKSGDFSGLDENSEYIFGGRSFTIYKVTGNGLEEVFTSGNDLEEISFEAYPEYYNASNDNSSLDDRSGKKGVEAESVATGVVDGRTYAFVALERIGGVVVYDVTDVENVSFVTYVNTRDFETVVPGSEVYEDGELDKWVTGGDVAPEGLCFVSSQSSPNGKALLLVASEVSGTVAVFEIE